MHATLKFFTSDKLIALAWLVSAIMWAFAGPLAEMSLVPNLAATTLAAKAAEWNSYAAFAAFVAAFLQFLKASID